MNDQELISIVLAGDKISYRKIVEKYHSMVFRVSMGFVHNKEDADDISQEVFVNAYLSLHKFKAKSSFSTWLYRITVNTCLNHIRGNQKRTIFQRSDNVSVSASMVKQTAEATRDAGPDQQIIEKQLAGFVQKAIDTLPDKQKTAFILSKYDDLPQKEIAIIMNVTEGAVEQLLQRARAKLKDKLKRYLNTD